MRPEIAQQGKTDPSQALGPRLQAGDMVNTDAQNLGIQSRELGFLSLVRRDLAASDGGKGKREKGQDDITAAKFAERNCSIQLAWQ